MFVRSILAPLYILGCCSSSCVKAPQCPAPLSADAVWILSTGINTLQEAARAFCLKNNLPDGVIDPLAQHLLENIEGARGGDDHALEEQVCHFDYCG